MVTTVADGQAAFEEKRVFYVLSSKKRRKCRQKLQSVLLCYFIRVWYQYFSISTIS